MRLENHIHQLLFHHDCVIVPKFGAFLSHPTSAFINAEDFTITPPHKTISFNSALKTNDGILAYAYAHSENCSIENASSIIDKDVEGWNGRLNNGESIVLDKIGALNRTEDGLLNFTPLTTENFLTDAFGLFPIKPNLVIHENEQHIVEENSKRSWSSLFAVASIIPIIVGGYFYFNTPQPVQNFVDHQWSGIVLPAIKEAVPNHFTEQTIVAEQKDEPIHNLPSTIEDPVAYLQATALAAMEPKDSTENGIVSQYEITVVEEKQLNEGEKEVKAIIKNTKPETAVVEPKATEKIVKNTTSQAKKYQIIASSLRRSEDADRMLSELKEKGFKNASIDYVKGRYYYVNFESFDSEEKAKTYMNELHKKRPDAWMRTQN